MAHTWLAHWDAYGGWSYLYDKADVYVYGALAVATPLHAKFDRLSCDLPSNLRSREIVLSYDTHNAHTSLKV